MCHIIIPIKNAIPFIHYNLQKPKPSSPRLTAYFAYARPRRYPRSVKSSLHKTQPATLSATKVLMLQHDGLQSLKTRYSQRMQKRRALWGARFKLPIVAVVRFLLLPLPATTNY